MFSYLNKKEIIETVNDFLSLIGQIGIGVCNELGKLGVFVIEALTISAKDFDLRKIIIQMHFIGVKSLYVVALTGLCIGAVLAKHTFDGLHRFGGAQDQFIGPLVYISMAREFGPIVSAIMLTARAGSAITAELGAMKISEQIDALKTLSIDPFAYLITPRIIGATIIMPFLSLFCTMFGISAGYMMAIHVMGVSSETYADSIKKMLEFSDISNGLIKASVFGFLAASICCYKGINTTGGSRGVGISTTQAVVYSSVTIFFANLILSMLLFRTK